MMQTVLIISGLLMVASSIAVIFAESVKKSAVIMGVVSLIASVVFVFMKAYDVAITEASIGAVLTTALYFWSIKRYEEQNEELTGEE